MRSRKFFVSKNLHSQVVAVLALEHRSQVRLRCVSIDFVPLLKLKMRVITSLIGDVSMILSLSKL